MNRRITWVVFGVLALAGCNAPAHPAHPAESSSTSATFRSSTSSSTAPTINVTLPPLNHTRTLQLDDCFGWSAVITNPGPITPGERPSGWNPAPSDTTFTGQDIQAYRCNRISLGVFERGPIHLMIESHSNADFPEKCTENTEELPEFGIASHIWIDDPEVASYLHNEYGAPVVLAQFNETSQDAGPSTLHTWTWATEGGQPSTMTIPDDKESQELVGRFTRNFWANGTSGLIQLDVPPKDYGPPHQFPGYGTMQPPTEFASDRGGNFAGSTAWNPVRAAAGTFTIYSDLQCEHPVP